ncbi:unnamed protein product [Brassicogethes aeneus]|uniref:Tudor domain-containing protein n=1 Tax=Brassicogethes aeneus TaxID=1431903 RepID=A0A9P0B4U8_BRAAE|nr:unnamed protein product [Brassicogethes aeneus]
MAPSYTRQLLALTLPSIAVILSYLWYKKKRIGAKSDPGETPVAPAEDLVGENAFVEDSNESLQSSPRSFTRSLSGVDSAPIDIVIPRELRSKSKSNPVIISDEDLDFEIEKIKSMKTGTHLNRSFGSQGSQGKSKTPSPSAIREDFDEEEDASPPSIQNIKFTQQSSPIKSNPTPIKQSLFELKRKSEAKNPSPKQRRNKKDKRAAMAQKDVAVVEEKLASLKINNNQQNKRSDSQRRSSERDSANHSPAEVMLASPSLSSISDNHSEKSTDSGKGGSDPSTPPPAHSVDPNQQALYEFIIPQPLVGKLIGKHGSFVSYIKDKANATLVAGKHPTNRKLKVCTVEGTQAEIDRALKMIRERFPIKRFPEVTLEQVHFIQPLASVPLIPDHLYLKLIEGINNDTILSCIAAPNHLFLQQPMHPTYPSLNVLVQFMNTVYREEGSPMLPTPIPENTICVAYSQDSWYRAITLSADVEKDTSYVKFLDFGGYAIMDNCNLRQIRGDFLLLPFQAAECILANIRPVGGDDACWAPEAFDLVAEVTKGALIYTQVLDYTEDGCVPLVFCYIVTTPNQPIYLNQLLVDHGFAEWIPTLPSTAAEVFAPVEGAVGITA